jgi:hypothetical protein
VGARFTNLRSRAEQVLNAITHVLAPLRHVITLVPFILAISTPSLALRVHSWPLNSARAERKSCRIPAALWRRRRSPVVPFVESKYPSGFYFYLLSTKNYVFRLMACGFHHCERLCHGDECGACTAPCGKLRKSWYVLHFLV